MREAPPPRFGLVVLALAALATSSCAADEARPRSTTSVPESPADQTTTSTTSELGQLCTARTFTVAYPHGWHTNEPAEGELCRYFHPDEVDVPKDSEAVAIAVHLRFDAVDYDFVTNPDNNSGDVLDIDRSEVDGRPAVRMHLRSTGEGLLDEGVESVAWYVDAGEQTFTGATHGVAEGGIEVNGPILDEMMNSLRFTREAPAESDPS